MILRLSALGIALFAWVGCTAPVPDSMQMEPVWPRVRRLPAVQGLIVIQSRANACRSMVAARRAPMMGPLPMGTVILLLVLTGMSARMTPAPVSVFPSKTRDALGFLTAVLGSSVWKASVYPLGAML